jgi:hypothetical protein
MSTRVIAAIALCVATAALVFAWQGSSATRAIATRIETSEETTRELRETVILQDEIFRIHRRELARVRTEMEELKKEHLALADSR